MSHRFFAQSTRKDKTNEKKVTQNPLKNICLETGQTIFPQGQTGVLVYKQKLFSKKKCLLKKKVFTLNLSRICNWKLTNALSV